MLTHVILEIRKLDAFYLKEDACLCHLIDVKPVTLALVTPVVSGLSKTNFRNDYHVAMMTHAVSLKPFMMPLSGNHLRGYLSCVYHFVDFVVTEQELLSELTESKFMNLREARKQHD